MNFLHAIASINTVGNPSYFEDKTKKSVLDALNKIDEIRLNTDIELEFLSDHAIDAMAIGYIDLKKGLSL